jgi:hypothetical protein
MANIQTKIQAAAQTFNSWIASYKTYPLVRRKIRESVVEVCTTLSGVDYLESNFRTLLARTLRSHGLEVYEEIIIPYTVAGYPLPIGHGFADIVIHLPESGGVVILELKANAKNCARQLQKYMRHWKYTGKVAFGMTINFHQDSISVNDYEEERQGEEIGSLDPSEYAQEVKRSTISGC